MGIRLLSFRSPVSWLSGCVGEGVDGAQETGLANAAFDGSRHCRREWLDSLCRTSRRARRRRLDAPAGKDLGRGSRVQPGDNS
jgi:hypothetical protein